MLRSYQEGAVGFLLPRFHAALFADPGCGKTLITLELLNRLRFRGVKRVLIIAPIRVCHHVWPAENEKWGYDFDMAVLHGPKKRDVLCKRVTKRNGIDVINPEGLKWLFEQELPDYDVLVVDESSTFKNPSSKRFKLLKRELKRFKRRYILTGTPTPRSLQDLWSQVYILDIGRLLGQYISHYRSAYFYQIMRGNYFDWKIQPGMDDIIYKRISPIAFRLDAESLLDLPDLVFNDIEVELPPKAKKVYRGLQKDLFAELDGAEVYADTAAVAYQMCQQVAGGALYREGGVEVLHDAKIDALKGLVEELGGKPILVAYKYKHELERLQKALPNNRAIHGGSSGKDDAQTISAWNADRVPVLLAQAQTISHGLNLQGGSCSDVVWFSLTDDFEVYEQLYRRVYRQGNKNKKVRVHHIVARDTVDSLIKKRLSSKDERQQSLFKALQEYARENDR